jgi:membrane protein YqaA with SNARE-associated domain
MSLADRFIHTLGSTRRGLVAFFGLGVLDGSFLPFPIEPFVLPIMAFRPRRAWVMAGALLAGCLTGTFLFYALGLLAGDAVVEPMIASFGMTAAYAEQLDAIRDDAFLTLFLIGLTPIPLQIGTLGAGVAGVDPVTFLVAMALSRGIRYALLALASVALGLGAERVLRRFQTPIILGSLLAAAVVFVGLRVGTH